MTHVFVVGDAGVQLNAPVFGIHLIPLYATANRLYVCAYPWATTMSPALVTAAADDDPDALAVDVPSAGVIDVAA